MLLLQEAISPLLNFKTTSHEDITQNAASTLTRMKRIFIVFLILVSIRFLQFEIKNNEHLKKVSITPYIEHFVYPDPQLIPTSERI